MKVLQILYLIWASLLSTAALAQSIPAASAAQGDDFVVLKPGVNPAGASPSGSPVMQLSGWVFSADSSTLVLRTDTGTYVRIVIPPGMLVLRSRSGTVADLKTGSTLVSGSAPDASGKITAREIVVYSGALPTNGRRPVWFKTPIKTFDRGTVQQVRAVSGSTAVRIANETGQKDLATDAAIKITVVEFVSPEQLSRDLRVQALVVPATNSRFVARTIEVANPGS